VQKQAGAAAAATCAKVPPSESHEAMNGTGAGTAAAANAALLKIYELAPSATARAGPVLGASRTVG